MRYDCKNLGFHFEMDNPKFIPLSDELKIKLFRMDEQQLKYNLYIFAEVDGDKFTGRYFQITLDGGFYPTVEDILNGQKYCVENVKRCAPNFKLIEESAITPNHIKYCVWQRQDGSIFAQYYVVKNGYMFCVAGDISKAHDDMDNLMASVCISTSSESKQDLRNEERRKLMQKVTEEANRLVDEGMSMDDAMSKALAKFGIGKK